MKRQKPKLEILYLRYTNCNLKDVYSTDSCAEVNTNVPPERVKAPYVVLLSNEYVFKESGCFVLQP